MTNIASRLSIALLFVCLVNTAFAKTYTFNFLNTKIEVIDSSEAAPIIVRNDIYTDHFSTFDIHGRLQDTTKFTEEDYLLYAEQQCQDWSAKETEKLKKCFAEIETFVNKNKLLLNLPVIRIIKTTGKEEMGAMGYTRSNNIMLNVSSETITTELMAHELFHVFSRYNELTRHTLYKMIGFRRCEHINVKAALQNRNLTNPDCPEISHYITVNDKHYTIILYSPRKYTGGNVFAEYLKIGLLELEGEGNKKTAKMANGEPVIREFSEVPDIMKQIGTNTNYALHPEEILAENFAALIAGKKVNEPIYLERIKATLTK